MLQLTVTVSTYYLQYNSCVLEVIYIKTILTCEPYTLIAAQLPL